MLFGCLRFIVVINILNRILLWLHGSCLFSSIITCIRVDYLPIGAFLHILYHRSFIWAHFSSIYCFVLFYETKYIFFLGYFLQPASSSLFYGMPLLLYSLFTYFTFSFAHIFSWVAFFSHIECYQRDFMRSIIWCIS